MKEEIFKNLKLNDHFSLGFMEKIVGFMESIGFNVNHLDIALRYAEILMGFSSGIKTLTFFAYFEF